MIFNYTILGLVTEGGTPVNSGTLTLDYYPSSISAVFSKSFTLQSGDYQFNLGDADLLGTAGSITSKDFFVIHYKDSVGNELWSNGKSPSMTDTWERYDIRLEESIPQTEQTAKIKQTNQIIKTTNYFFYENSENLYNYYLIEKNGNPYSEKWGDFSFYPDESAQFKITQRSVDKTSRFVSSDTYTFNAIVSSAYIDSSSQCKSLNESVKLFFVGEDETAVPSIRVRNNDGTILYNGEMTADKPGIWSFDWLFTEIGYILFEIDARGERFLQSFRIQNRNFRIYYVDEYLKTGLSPSFQLYFESDLYTPIKSGNLYEIGSGTYSSEEWGDLAYGGYVVEIGGERFRLNYKECVETTREGSSAITETDASVYWIYPQTYEA